MSSIRDKIRDLLFHYGIEEISTSLLVELENLVLVEILNFAKDDFIKEGEKIAPIPPLSPPPSIPEVLKDKDYSVSFDEQEVESSETPEEELQDPTEYEVQQQILKDEWKQKNG